VCVRVFNTVVDIDRIMVCVLLYVLPIELYTRSACNGLLTALNVLCKRLVLE
jgi:hypothetical protein